MLQPVLSAWAPSFCRGARADAPRIPHPGRPNSVPPQPCPAERDQPPALLSGICRALAGRRPHPFGIVVPQVSAPFSAQRPPRGRAPVQIPRSGVSGSPRTIPMPEGACRRACVLAPGIPGDRAWRACVTVGRRQDLGAQDTGARRGGDGGGGRRGPGVEAGLLRTARRYACIIMFCAGASLR